MRLLHITSILILIFLGSCTKNFEELNTDPNRPKAITPGVILGQLQYRMVNTTIQQGRSFGHQLMQVDAPRASPDGQGLHRYFLDGGGVWGSFYNYLADIKDIYELAEKSGEKNYMGIALVYKAWTYSILTDSYGDVPFTEATRATEGIFQAKYDKQIDIYKSILQDLETANSIFDPTKALSFGGDLVYNANSLSGSVNQGIIKWKRFCNSLRLRLLLRIIKTDGEINVAQQINTLLADPAKYPVFTSNTDEAIFRYPGIFPYFNPYFNARQLEWRDGTYFTKFFLDKLNADEDPRRMVWTFPVTINGSQVYRGIESGYPVTTEYQVGANSSYNDVMRNLSQLGVMMTYAEVEFIKAELALKGFSTGNSTKGHYQNGIAASMKQWGVNMPSTFLEKPGVKFNEQASTELQLESIILQKYIAYFFVDYQSWFEKRRTGYPILPRGAGIPVENQFPRRIPYPTSQQSLNAANLEVAVSALGGVDNSDARVWWDK